MNRHDRRKANMGMRKIIVTSEIFDMNFANGTSLNLDVMQMRTWAEANCTIVKMPVDPQYLDKLVADGTVTEKRVMGHAIRQMPKPILVCERPNGEGDQIVDGNHAYVAAAFQWMAAYEQGLVQKSETPFVLGYALTETQWRPFVVPPSRLSEKCRMRNRNGAE